MEIMIFLTVGMIMPIKWIFGIQMSWNPLLWVSFCVHTNCRILPAPKSWLSGCFVLFSCKHLLSKTLCYQHVSLYDSCNGDIIPIAIFLFASQFTLIVTTVLQILFWLQKKCCWPFSHNWSFPSFLSYPKSSTLASSAPSIGKYWTHCIKFSIERNCLVLNRHHSWFINLLSFMKFSTNFFLVSFCSHKRINFATARYTFPHLSNSWNESKGETPSQY